MKILTESIYRGQFVGAGASASRDWALAGRDGVTCGAYLGGAALLRKGMHS